MSLVGENRVVKEFKHLWRGWLRIFNSYMVSVLDGAHVLYVGCCVCSWGDALTLSDVPGGGK